MWFEIHCHSNRSDGKNTPDEMVDFAKKNGLSGIVITDHDTIDGSLEMLKHNSPEFQVIPGMEVSSRDGHILALNVRELIPKDLSAKETVERIHSAGGIAIAAHPYDRYRSGVGDLMHEVDFDAVEVLNGHTFGNTKDPAVEAKKSGLPMVGGTDAHTAKEVGGVRIKVPK
ncbi:MAG TPA: PHP domain-containing protein, partial [Candidatus Altiarchaeales archaeon]|nr:PHP domain-containing protein [Candidatus Altiarchaeales archaeon]